MIELVRLYTDEAGDSRFEDLTLVGETRGIAESSLLAQFSEPIPATKVFLCNVVRDGSSSERHNTALRQLIIQLTGEIEIEASAGERRRFGPGSVLLVEDIVGKGHITRPVSGGQRLTFVVELPDDPASWSPGIEPASNARSRVR